MYKFLAKCTIIGLIVALDFARVAPVRAEAEINDGYIGPAVTFGDGGTSFGAAAKMRLGKNFSLRPYITFPSDRVNNYGASLTYDFSTDRNSPALVPFVGWGFGVDSSKNPNVSGFFHLGIDAYLNDKWTLFAGATIPTSKEYNGRFIVGTSLRF